MKTWVAWDGQPVVPGTRCVGLNAEGAKVTQRRREEEIGWPDGDGVAFGVWRRGVFDSEGAGDGSIGPPANFWLMPPNISAIFQIPVWSI